MKRTLFLTVILACAGYTKAQQNVAPEPTPVIITTYYVDAGTRGTGYNVDSMVNYYIDKGVRPNAMLKNFRILGHWWGDDNARVLFIYEVDKFENINKAFGKTAELLNASFANDADKRSFWDRWSKLFNHHEDNIMEDIGKPKM